jgi:hypothetical protein
VIATKRTTAASACIHLATGMAPLITNDEVIRVSIHATAEPCLDKECI